MAYFKAITSKATKNKQNVVIMGRKTWESIPEEYKPLKNRVNIILTKQKEYIVNADNTYLFNYLNDALNWCAGESRVNQVFIVGGGMLYQEAVGHPQCEKIYLTQILQSFSCDTHFPKFSEEQFKATYISNIYHFKNMTYFFKILSRL